MKSAYKPGAVFSSGPKIGQVSYQLDIVLSRSDTLAGLKLPTISHAYDVGKAQAVPKGYTIAAIITAIDVEETSINDKISSSGIHLTFTVPSVWVEEGIGESRLKPFHIKDGIATPADIIHIQGDGSDARITIRGDGFSTYGPHRIYYSTVVIPIFILW